MVIVHTCRCETKFTMPPWSAEHVHRITYEMHLSVAICLLCSRNLLALCISRFISALAEAVRSGIVQLGFSYGWINTSCIFTVMIFSAGPRMQLIIFINTRPVSRHLYLVARLPRGRAFLHQTQLKYCSLSLEIAFSFHFTHPRSLCTRKFSLNKSGPRTDPCGTPNWMQWYPQ